MILGTLAGRIAGVALSYGMHSFRPQFSLLRLRAIWSFSQWVLFKNIGSYFDGSIDRLLVGNRFSSDVLGGYTVGKEIASLPTTELLMPIGRVLFPAFVEKRDDPAAFSNRVTLAIGVQGLVAIPACLGLIFVAGDLIAVALGEKWLFITAIMQIMALTNMIGTLVHSLGYALLAMGKVKVQALITWLQALFSLVLVFAFGLGETAEDFALIRMSAVGVGSVILIGIVLYDIRVLSLRSFIHALIRPLIATGVMWAALDALHPALKGVLPGWRLILEVATGTASYGLTIFMSWFVAGRPDGAEAYLISNIRLRYR